MSEIEIPEITEEDAFHFIANCLCEGGKTEFAHYGYDLHLPQLFNRYIRTVMKHPFRLACPRSRPLELTAALSHSFELAQRNAPAVGEAHEVPHGPLPRDLRRRPERRGGG